MSAKQDSALATRRDEKRRKGSRNKIHGFFEVALKDFGHVGGIFPSSPWASRSIVKHLPHSPDVVVEYGPGNGTLTEHILEKLPRNARLVGIEVNQDFVSHLKTFADPRLEVLHGDVLERSAVLKDFARGGVDAVVSGIPFTFLSPAEREKVLERTRDGLRAGGRFIVYQNSLRMKDSLRRVFGKVDSYFEPRNIFPYFIMVATR